MLTVTITMGLPASGKTTWAKEVVDDHPGQYKRINKDDLRAMLDNSKYSKSNEDFILEVRNHLILSVLTEGKHVIVDDTNLEIKHRIAIEELIKGKAKLIINDTFLKVSVEECIKRDLKRFNSVGEAVILSMYNKFLKPVILSLDHNPNLNSAIIFDLDGTLCNLNGRNPYDASTCELDLPNSQVIELYSMYSRDYSIILMSGREDKYREQTERWLVNNQIEYTALYMRQTGDSRKDTIIKLEMYNEHIKDKFNIRFVVDDRPSVLRMWKDLGLFTFNVGEGVTF